jgi:biotin---protein ligase
LNKSDGGKGFVDIIDDLLVHDSGRNAFLRALLVKLGLKVSVENGTNGCKEIGTPSLTPLHISSSNPSLNEAIYNSLIGIADNPPSQEGDPLTITETNDTFHVQYLTSPLDSMRDLRQVLNGHYRSRSVDPNPKDIFLHPLPMTYPYFSQKEYFQNLPPTSKIGQTLAYVEVTTSTQTILDKNPVLLRSLPSGFCITSTSQLNGRGRAGNAWISPRGSLAFSYVIRLPRHLSSRLVFVQYLVSLAVVEGIRTYAPGWEDVNVCIKWPNDIYGKPRTSDRWEKIGGIMVNSTYLENEYVLVPGISPLLIVLICRLWD